MRKDEVKFKLVREEELKFRVSQERVKAEVARKHKELIQLEEFATKAVQENGRTSEAKKGEEENIHNKGFRDFQPQQQRFAVSVLLYCQFIRHAFVVLDSDSCNNHSLVLRYQRTTPKTKVI